MEQEALPTQIELTKIEKDILDLILEVQTANNLQLTLRVAGGWVRDKVSYY